MCYSRLVQNHYLFTDPNARFVGFGSSPAPTQDSQPDFLSGAMSSLSTGWQTAAKWTSSAAVSAKEGVSWKAKFSDILFTDLLVQAVKLGSQANVLATDLSSKVNEKVVKPTQQKISDGRVVDDLTSSMTSWAGKFTDYSKSSFEGLSNLIQNKK